MEIIGIIVVSLILWYVAAIGIVINFLPSDMNIYQRILGLVWTGAWLWVWWTVVGSGIKVTVG